MICQIVKYSECQKQEVMVELLHKANTKYINIQKYTSEAFLVISIIFILFNFLQI